MVQEARVVQPAEPEVQSAEPVVQPAVPEVRVVLAAQQPAGWEVPEVRAVETPEEPEEDSASEEPVRPAVPPSNRA